MKDKKMPNEKLINAVRNIVTWSHISSLEGVDEELSFYIEYKLLSIMQEFEIEISVKESKGRRGVKAKLTYTLSYKGIKELEFTDLLIEGENNRVLECVNRYIEGEWEQKLVHCRQRIHEIKFPV